MVCLIVSQEFYDDVSKSRVALKEVAGMPFRMTALDGIPFQVSPLLPIHKQRLRAKPTVRFLEFDNKDADWAIPAGLAEWGTEEVHCMQVNI